MRTAYKAIKASWGGISSPKRVKQAKEEEEEEEENIRTKNDPEEGAGAHPILAQEEDKPQEEPAKIDCPFVEEPPVVQRAIMESSETTTILPPNEKDGIPKEIVSFVKDPILKEKGLEFDDLRRGKETLLKMDPKLLEQVDTTVEVNAARVTIDALDRIIVPENPPPVEEEEEIKPVQAASNNCNTTFEERFLLNAFDEEAKALKVTATEDKVVLEDTLLLEKEATTDLLWKPVYNPKDPEEGDLHVAACTKDGTIHIDRQMLVEPNQQDGGTMDKVVIPAVSCSDSEEDTALASPPRTTKARAPHRKSFKEGDTKWIDDLNTQSCEAPKKPPAAKRMNCSTLLFLIWVIAMEYLLITKLWAVDEATTTIANTNSAPVAATKPPAPVPVITKKTTKENPMSELVAENIVVTSINAQQLQKKEELPKVLPEATPLEDPLQNNSESGHGQQQPPPNRFQSVVATLEDIFSNALPANQGYGH